MQRERMATGGGWVGLLVSMILAMAFFQAPAVAQQITDAFVVRDINVNKSGLTGVQARELGLAEARQAAFSHLYQRLVPRGYYRAEPKLLPEQLNALIATVDVAQEQTTSTNYRARLAIGFSPSGVRQLLSERRIPFTDRISPPLLILPVYEWAGVRQLWEVPNPWHSAWSERVGAQGLITTAMARGSAEEQLLLSADQALSGDSASLQELAKSYGAGGAVVALARFRVDPRTAKPVLDATLRGYGAAPSGPIQDRFEGGTGGRAGMAAEQLARTAAESMAHALADAWKASNARRSSSPGNSMLISVPLSYLGDYAAVNRRISEVRTIDRVVLARLSGGEAQFRVFYSSDLEQVRRGFDQLGMRLLQRPGGWLLRING